MHVQTLCLHGDSPNALIFASSLNRFLKENNIDLA
jgi:lactam utilization protein B